MKTARDEENEQHRAVCVRINITAHNKNAGHGLELKAAGWLVWWCMARIGNGIRRRWMMRCGGVGALSSYQPALVTVNNVTMKTSHGAAKNGAQREDKMTWRRGAGDGKSGSSNMCDVKRRVCFRRGTREGWPLRRRYSSMSWNGGTRCATIAVEHRSAASAKKWAKTRGGGRRR
jgi:hypothetical protein